MEEKTVRNRITEGNIPTQLLSYFFPLLVGSVFQTLYNTVDSIIVGRFVGANALAAVGGSGIVIGLLIGFFMGVGGGGTVIISQYYGAQNEEKLSKAVHPLKSELKSLTSDKSIPVRSTLFKLDIPSNIALTSVG